MKIHWVNLGSLYISGVAMNSPSVPPTLTVATSEKRPYSAPILNQLGTWQALTLVYSAPFDTFKPFQMPKDT